MMINKESILYQTHQAWKYRVKVVLNGFGFFFISLIILLQINIVRFTYLSDVELSVIGLGFFSTKQSPLLGQVICNVMPKIMSEVNA